MKRKRKGVRETVEYAVANSTIDVEAYVNADGTFDIDGIAGEITVDIIAFVFDYCTDEIARMAVAAYRKRNHG